MISQLTFDSMSYIYVLERDVENLRYKKGRLGKPVCRSSPHYDTLAALAGGGPGSSVAIAIGSVLMSCLAKASIKAS